MSAAETRPSEVEIRACDVLPYHWALWCTVCEHNGGRPFANEIVARRWSDDGKRIWFMLDTHNFFDADPDELLSLVPEQKAHGKESAESAARFTNGLKAFRGTHETYRCHRVPVLDDATKAVTP